MARHRLAAYGGQGRSPIEQHIFIEEAQVAGAPLPLLTINSVAPTLMRFGTQEQKDALLPPGILAGEIQFAIGYSEPGAGTDLAVVDPPVPNTTAMSG